MAAPRGPFRDPDRGRSGPPGLGQAPRARRRRTPAPIAIGRGCDEPLEEQLAERLVVAVQLAVGGDHDQRRLVVGERPGAIRGSSRPGRSGRRRRSPCGSNETARRQVAVVEGHDHVAAIAELDAVRPPRVDVARRRPATGARIVWRMPASASTRSVARSTAVSGSHIPIAGRPNRTSKSRRPQRDLGPPIGRGGERQDRVMERLGHAR